MKATFAAGCFWGVEATFRALPGVTATRVGYTGGNTVNPTYKDVCTDTTGHAEAVEVDYDPAEVSYDQLLNVFWENHGKSGIYSKPIATQIVPATTFYEAEDYHQQYLEKRGMATCHIKA